MNPNLNRRSFIQNSVLASAAAAVSVGAADSAPVSAPTAGKVSANSKGTLPTGKIGTLTVSRLISGGNLISGWAHSRDLQYIPSLMRAYNTEARMLDTLQLLEENGVNTIIADPAKNCMEIFARYWKERGGKMQWIAEGHPEVSDLKTNIQRSVDFGAAAVYIQGVIGDRWLKEGHQDLQGTCLQLLKSQKVPAGIGAHKLEVVMESEKKNYGAEFYVKTLHDTCYWSARRPDQSQDVIDNGADNYWDIDPKRTIAFMSEVGKPWIAFKTLAAGAIQPEHGFRYAFENGADFICVGMFDFQVEQNVALIRKLLPEVQNRDRSWRG